jgi:EmrB/QacA subfamily drug resistance transporter
MPSRAELQARINPKVAVSVVFVAAMFMSIMDTSIVNVALPSIGRDFRVAPTAVDGISIAFLVSLAVFMPASGWLGDRFGGKRVLMAAIVIFTAASALCGVATNLGELVAFRVLQGVGGGMLAPVGTAMLFRTFPPEERVRAASIIVLPTALAPALAPVVGGLLVTDATWRWVFYVNVPIGIAALIFGLLFVTHSVESRPGVFDRPGFLLSGVGLGLFMYGVSEGPDLGWGSPRILITGLVGAALLVTMVIVELRTREPIVALRLLGNRLFRSATGVVVMVSIAFLGVLFAITLYFQDGRGLSALDAGLSQFPTAIGVMAGSQLASRVIYWRLGPRRHLALGLLGVATFIAMLALMGAHTSLWWARLILFAVGFSMAQVFVPAQAASFATISPADTGRASTLYNASRQLGGAIGVAVLTTTIVIVGPTHVEAGHAVANLTAYRVAFLVAAGAALLGVLSSLMIRDADAAQTMVNPRDRKSAPATAPAAGPAAAAAGEPVPGR